MRNLLLRIVSGVILMTFLFLGYSSGANAALITKTLDEDTKLIPHGIMAISSMPVFKKGTTVTLNENGEVIEGILASSPWLNCVSLQYDENGRHYFRQYGHVFHEGTKVRFNNKGEVVKGTFSHNHDRTIAVPISARSYVSLRALSEVSFHPNGILASGTLNAWDGVYLRPAGWQQINILTDNTGGFVKFKDRTIIELNDKGEVIKGVLHHDTKLLSPIGIKSYEKDTTVEFDDKGLVIKAVK